MINRLYRFLRRQLVNRMSHHLVRDPFFIHCFSSHGGRYVSPSFSLDYTKQYLIVYVGYALRREFIDWFINSRRRVVVQNEWQVFSALSAFY